VVGGIPIRLADDEVVHFRGGHGDVAEGIVVDRHVAGGAEEAHHDGAPLGAGFLGVVGRRERLRARVAERLLRVPGGLAESVQLLGRVEGVVRLARVEELLRAGLVEVQPFGLPVRTGRSADVDALIPFDAQPPQVVDDFRDGRLVVAGAVGVFDPQQERPAGLAGDELIFVSGSTVSSNRS